MKLDDRIKDATYYILPVTDGSLVARFSTQSLAKIDPACDASFGQLGALEKTTTSTDRLGNPIVPIFKLGTYYFTYETPQALCSEKVRSSLNDLMSAFRDSLKSLQSDQ